MGKERFAQRVGLTESHRKVLLQFVYPIWERRLHDQPAAPIAVAKYPVKEGSGNPKNICQASKSARICTGDNAKNLKCPHQCQELAPRLCWKVHRQTEMERDRESSRRSERERSH